jgi:hypothetical protein
MSELEKPTSTCARMRSKHALKRLALTALLTLSMPESAYTKGRPAITRCTAVGSVMEAWSSPQHPSGARRHGLPTKVVTDCASREPENRPAVTGMDVPAARLELDDVTYGVTVLGHAVPETRNETF